jgi:protein SCO1
MRSDLGLLAVLAAAAAVAALIVVLLLTGPGEHARHTPAPVLDTATGFAGAALPQPVPAPPFALRDELGQALGPMSFPGQVKVLAFLSAGCGRPCILIAQQVRGALDDLLHPVPVLFVTADPGGDTPVRVRRFLATVSLTGRVYYLTGSRRAVRAVWDAYGVVPASAGDAAFARAATVRLLDGQARERVLFGPEQLTPEGLAHDVRKLSG